MYQNDLGTKLEEFYIEWFNLYKKRK